MSSGRRKATHGATSVAAALRSGWLRHVAIIAVGILVLVGGVGAVRHFSPEAESTSSHPPSSPDPSATGPSAGDTSSTASDSTSSSGTSSSSTDPGRTDSMRPNRTPSGPELGRKLVGQRPRLVRYPTVKSLDDRYRPQGLYRVGPRERRSFTFRVGSYNMLGASHTTGPKGRPGYAGYAKRLGPQVALLESHGVTVAGLQEFQHPQSNMLTRIRGGRYGVYPGVKLGTRLSQNSIIWRTDTWEVVKQQTTPIPYFGGHRVPMPQVLLRHKASGRTVWFGNFHNPANIGGPHAKWRALAIQIEANLAKTLGSDGTPVIMTGDMNDRELFACPFSKQSGMHSPNGARTTSSGCQTPGKMSVDWIMGTPNLTFDDYTEDWSSRNRRLSDHPLIAATTTAVGALDRPGCVKARSRDGVRHYCPRT